MNEKKTVLVCGDAIIDNNLIKPDYLYGILESSSILGDCFVTSSHGGFWYLADMIECVCSDVSDKIHIEVPKKIDKNLMESISQAYQIWRYYEKVEGKPDEKVFRIENFLGYYTPKNSAKDAETILTTYKDISNPDLLVIDDLGLGFCNSNREWSIKFVEGKEPKSIILKASASLITTSLWGHLQNSDLLNRLTVVISVESLRSRGGAISKAISWDKTMDDIVYEFKKGISAQDLARCRRVIVIFGNEGIASIAKDPMDYSATVRLERFIYNPDYLEGSWELHRKGKTFGSRSIITSALVRHEIFPETFPIFIALSRGLEAICRIHEAGAGYKVFDSSLSLAIAKEVLHPKKNNQNIQNKEKVGERLYYCSFYGDNLLNQPNIDNERYKSNLLMDAIGWDLESIYTKATDIVLYGTQKAFESIPKVKYGKYLTADRDEIDRINAIRNMIKSYKENRKDTHPLSIAIFGAPGSGKSFAIEQLGEDLFGKELSILKFNLTQLKAGNDDLIKAFHQIRDASVQLQIPFVFWDEFDTNNLEWLKHFLVPMEEARFQDGGISHYFGKAVFVFAGGVFLSFEKFQKFDKSGKLNNESTERSVQDDLNIEEEKTAEEMKEFKNMKGPDFISRLRGFMNIKSINPLKKSAEFDLSYLIRRAIILRASLEKLAPYLINEDTKIASISSGVVRGFLKTDEYLHGARSMDSIVRMSLLSESQKYFGASQLPSKELLELHASKDFIDKVLEGELEATITEVLAEECHRAWKGQKEKQGWRCGEKSDSERKTIDRDRKIDYRLVEYDKLDEKDKEENRKPARLTKPKLLKVGCDVIREIEVIKDDIIINDFEKEQITDKKTLLNELMLIEHDIWLRNRLIKGYEYGKKTEELLKIHRDIDEFKELPEEDKKFDEDIVRSIIPTLKKCGYVVIKKR